MITDNVWITKDGKHIPVPEMTDEHLVNSWNFFNRKMREFSESIEAIGSWALNTPRDSIFFSDTVDCDGASIIDDLDAKIRGCKLRLDMIEPEIARRDLWQAIEDKSTQTT